MSGRVPRCTRGGMAASMRGGGVPVRGALLTVLATVAVSRTTLSERRQPQVISARILLARVHPPRHYLLLPRHWLSLQHSCVGPQHARDLGLRAHVDGTAADWRNCDAR